MSMSAAQYTRLSGIVDQLYDVLAEECDPKNWPGAGVAPPAWDRDTRGDRYWHKKNAAGTMSLIARAQSIFKAEFDNAARRTGVDAPEAEPPLEPVTPGADFDLDRDVAKWEAEAKRAIDAASKRGPAG